VIVDSAQTTAEAVHQRLHAPQDPAPAPTPPAEEGPRVRLWATDDPGRFARVGGRFLDLVLHAEEIEVVDL
jgi:glutamate racemase